MANSTSGVMLLTLEAESYRKHIAWHTALAKINTGEKIPDFRAPFAKSVELNVRKELELHFASTNYRVLRWEEVDRASRKSVRYRELDGVYKTKNGTTVLLEVKASASKGSLRSGLRQLRSAVRTLRIAQPSALGVLTVANLGALIDGFGKPESGLIADMLRDEDVTAIDWPPQPERLHATGEIYFALVPETLASAWISGIPLARASE